MTDSQVGGGIHMMSLEHFTAPKTTKCAIQANSAKCSTSEWQMKMFAIMKARLVWGKNNVTLDYNAKYK